MLLSSANINEDWLMVKAKQGDGIKKLLVRYHLDTHSCNEEKFLSLNNLSPEADLILDKTYLLPIKQVSFDGKSIRSSLGITEFEKAKEIEKYNEQLVSDGIKSKPFQVDKMLWIPHHFSPCNLPVTSTEKGFPIFGKYESTPILSDVLKGKIFY
ncbi:MAG: N-acetylmuramoyl-L-alanine amidase, partial [Bacteroidota bacterium]